MLRKTIPILLALLTGWSAAGLAAEQRDLQARLQQMLDGHEKLAAVEAEERGSQAALAKAWSSWFPQLRITAAQGAKSGYDTTNGDFHIAPQERTVTLDQTLWDFGKTSAEVAKAEVATLLAQTSRENTRQTLLFDAGSAWVNLCRAVGTVDLARQSVDNIRKQTGLEQIRVELGGGLPTDVLQSKSQLAGAEARLVRAEGALNVAINHFRTLFGELPPEPSTLHRVNLRPGLMPASLDELLAVGLEENLEIKTSALAVAMANEERQRVTGAELFPRIAAVVEHRNNRQTDVINVRQQETLAKVEASFNFNTGLGGVHSLRVAREGVAASRNRLTDVRNTVQEQLRNAWDNLGTARRNAKLLLDQTSITEAFLRLAREERLLGRRSLVDVLSGETSLYNAQSDALAAQSDLVIAALSQLKIMGRLEVDLLVEDEPVCLPPRQVR